MFRRRVADVLLVVVMAFFGLMVGADNIVAEINRRAADSAKIGKIAHDLDKLSPYWRRWVSR